VLESAPGKHPGPGLKVELTVRDAELGEQDVQGGQSGVPAEINFHRWGEPTQGPSVTGASNKCSFRNTKFECDLLQFAIGHGALEEHDDRRITPSGVTGEGVDPPNAVAKG
jgi:hypothetical protein